MRGNIGLKLQNIPLPHIRARLYCNAPHAHPHVPNLWERVPCPDWPHQSPPHTSYPVIQQVMSTCSSSTPKNEHDWFKRVTCLNIPQLKLGNSEWYSLNFPNHACCEKHSKDNKHNNLHLARKQAQMFVLGHNLFLKAHNFPRASLSENCSLLGTERALVE